MADIVKGMLNTGSALVLLGLATVVSADDFLDLAPLSADQLDSASGRQGVPLQLQLNDTEQNAAVIGNVISGPSMTGDNIISDQAFGNMSGIATVIQNTGNQVVIQDSTQVNIHINH
ncbi:hypothetical protein [Marinobacter qingdaonensis]|jgi:hypothetical protein|uniref:Uncharacterized protein n=1 Tax=Marinobacter qingdaonensis TaxID=3108486 RepID=A0ABU5NXX8_9GAMM|nr:hypothetical protein [Marinobacter sp. ASW11-75]MEA1080660.1 hypothetical protein [Marinobacter sp. ASW11-75]